MAEIMCVRAGKMIDMNVCRDCYYKRLPEDVSTVWCKYRIKEEVKKNRKKNLEQLMMEIAALEAEQDRKYRMGRPLEAEAMYEKIRVKKAERRTKIMINEAIAHITDEAMKINEPGAIKIEEYLTAKCTGNTVAEKLLDKEKSLGTLYAEIRKMAKRKAVNGMAMIPDQEIYDMVDEYYGLNETPGENGKESPAGEVDLFGFL